MTLNEHPLVKRAAVRAHVEPLSRLAGVTTRDGEPGLVYQPSRFVSIVDEQGTELGAVTERYKNINTADIVGLLDLHTERVGMRLEPVEGQYRNGNARIVFDIPDLGQRDRQDRALTPRIYFWHGLGGRGGIKFATGINIRICSNGMILGTILEYVYARHSTNVDLEELVTRALASVDERVDKDFRFIQAARETRIETPKFVEETGRILDSVGKRNREAVSQVLGSNASTYGNTAWALVQSVTEIATHAMRRSDGDLTQSSDAFQRQHIQHLTREFSLA